jgi:hypothetical protein
MNTRNEAKAKPYKDVYDNTKEHGKTMAHNKKQDKTPKPMKQWRDHKQAIYHGSKQNAE